MNRLQSDRDYTLEELAAHWNVHPQTVRRWIDAKAFPNAYKQGPGKNSRILIPGSDAITYETERKLVKLPA